MRRVPTRSAGTCSVTFSRKVRFLCWRVRPMLIRLSPITPKTLAINVGDSARVAEIDARITRDQSWALANHEGLSRWTCGFLAECSRTTRL
jgi:hypothetical protein